MSEGMNESKRNVNGIADNEEPWGRLKVESSLEIKIGKNPREKKNNERQIKKDKWMNAWMNELMNEWVCEWMT